MLCPSQPCGSNLGALLFRIGFWGPLYYNHNKEPPKPYSNYSGPYLTFTTEPRLERGELAKHALHAEAPVDAGP